VEKQDPESDLQDPVDRFIPVVYEELRAMAVKLLSDKSAAVTLAPTSLVHEAYFRLLEQHSNHWQDRLHFFRIAARVMRRVLVDHCRTRAAQKRGGAFVALALEEAAEVAAPSRDVDVLAVDRLLAELEAADPQQGSAGGEVNYAFSLDGGSTPTLGWNEVPQLFLASPYYQAEPPQAVSWRKCAGPEPREIKAYSVVNGGAGPELGLGQSACAPSSGLAYFCQAVATHVGRAEARPRRPADAGDGARLPRRLEARSDRQRRRGHRSRRVQDRGLLVGRRQGRVVVGERPEAATAVSPIPRRLLPGRRCGFLPEICRRSPLFPTSKGDRCT
jgi:RNA polymerase sigma factor (TIGR02999 family)